MFLTIDDVVSYDPRMKVTTTSPCCPQPSKYAYPNKAIKKNMEDTMSTTYTTINADATDKNVTAAKDFLQRRLSSEKYKKLEEINKVFHLTDDPAPKSAKETLDRIQKGLYVLPPKYLENSEDDEDDFCCFSPTEVMYQIRWRDPAVKEDKEGAKAATKALEAAYQKAYDTATVLDAEKGLAALTEFQAYTIQ